MANDKTKFGKAQERAYNWELIKEEEIMPHEQAALDKIQSDIDKLNALQPDIDKLNEAIVGSGERKLPSLPSHCEVITEGGTMSRPFDKADGNDLVDINYYTEMREFAKAALAANTELEQQVEQLTKALQSSVNSYSALRATNAELQKELDAANDRLRRYGYIK